MHRNWWVRMHGGAPNWLTVLAVIFLMAMAVLYFTAPSAPPESTWTPPER